MRAEMESVKQKYGQLKRNYDSVSLHAKKDAAANQKILDMKEAYEKEIAELKSAKTDAEAELVETKVNLTSAENKNKENNQKIASQGKEIDTLKKELAKTQKGFESQLT